MSDQQNLVRTLSKLAAQGGGLEEAVRELEGLGIPRDRIAAAREQYLREAERIRSLSEVSAIDAADELPPVWYRGPQDGHVFWPALERVLSGDPDLDAAAVGMVDRASDAVVSRIARPGDPEFSFRGLVLGHVQSGKTTNFTAVAAKAADWGYRLVIVLSGLTNNLREQTQKRIEEMLVLPGREDWYNLTEEGDFKSPGNAANILSNQAHRIIGVIKKNPSRLRRLNRWLDSAPDEVLRNLPILVIDDEADQASIDIGSEDERSKINDLILRLIDRPKVSYIGYTATPFANLLIDPTYPEGLYPRHFILDLPRPEGYFGAETLFGREPLTHDEHGGSTDGYDMIRHVHRDEITRVRPPWNREQREEWEPALTSSLEDAVLYFLIATAARRVRGTGVEHSTMLVHTTQLTEPQFQIREPIRDLLREVESRLDDGDAAFLRDLQNRWEEETTRVPPETFGEEPVAFDAFLEQLPGVIEDISVMVDNYRAEERLDYDEGPQTIIVIGGNTLSRGLTLEGLVVSYFVRSTSYYDTLLQMGRWFGYRDGYADLPRVWMPSDLQEWFNHLATVEQEIRYEIRRYRTEGLTPLDVPVRIRSHPQLNVTSAAKMGSAISAQMSFERRRVQTILFHHRDEEWLRNNLEATRELVRTAVRRGHPPRDLGRGRWILQDVPADQVLSFIDAYRFHEESHDLRSDLLAGYIREQNGLGELESWNVVIMGTTPGNGRRGIDLELGRPVGLLNRSRIDNPGIPHANIKALMSRTDIVVDLGIDAAALDDRSFENLIGMRPGGLGLLLIYPIEQNSTPGATAGGRQRRVDLEAVEDVIGVGFVFPRSANPTPQNYVSADLSGIEREELDIETAEELDPGLAEDSTTEEADGTNGEADP